jgi:hypothetical protein
VSNSEWKKKRLADRRKAERRRDRETARRWMGLERRIADRRSSEELDSDEEASEAKNQR